MYIRPYNFGLLTYQNSRKNEKARVYSITEVTSCIEPRHGYQQLYECYALHHALLLPRDGDTTTIVPEKDSKS